MLPPTNPDFTPTVAEFYAKGEAINSAAKRSWHSHVLSDHIENLSVTSRGTVLLMTGPLLQVDTELWTAEASMESIGFVNDLAKRTNESNESRKIEIDNLTDIELDGSMIFPEG